jgi:two-component system response regulator GlrR
VLSSLPLEGNVRELQVLLKRELFTPFSIRSSALDAITRNDHKPVFSEEFPDFKQHRIASEKAYLIRLLQICGGDVAKASKVSKKYRSDLYELFKRHTIQHSDFKNKKE